MGEGCITVLLVEDDLEDRDLIIEDLEPISGSYRVEHAGRLQEAMALAKSRSFDVILLDLGLPDSQGLDTFIQMYDIAPDAPFVIITGRDYDDTARKALDQRILKTQGSPGAILRKMAEQMGTMFAGPRDILDVHMEALRRRCRAQTPRKVKALTEEGRFLMIELMGNLASFYRDYYSGCSKTYQKDDNETVTGEK